MANEIVNQNTFMTVADIKKQVGLIHQIMSTIMKDGTHYGKIPGCGDKPALLKPGAEKIMMAFHLTADSETETLMDNEDEYRVRIKTRIYNRQGELLGTGLGEASSSEEKYKWRGSVCDQEWDEADIDRKREKWVKGWSGKPDYKKKQIRTEVADIRNTIVKMCAKRSLIAGILNVTACGDLFTQDIDDMSDEVRSEIMGDKKEAVAMPETKADVKKTEAKKETKQESPSDNQGEKPQGTITEAQRKLLYARQKASGITDEQFDMILTWKGVTSTTELDKGDVDDILLEIEKTKQSNAKS